MSDGWVAATSVMVAFGPMDDRAPFRGLEHTI